MSYSVASRTDAPAVIEPTTLLLDNPTFLAKAKPEVVDAQRVREADAARDRDRLVAAYRRLAAV